MSATTASRTCSNKIGLSEPTFFAISDSLAVKSLPGQMKLRHCNPPSYEAAFRKLDGARIRMRIAGNLAGDPITSPDMSKKQARAQLTLT